MAKSSNSPISCLQPGQMTGLGLPATLPAATVWLHLGYGWATGGVWLPRDRQGGYQASGWLIPGACPAKTTCLFRLNTATSRAKQPLTSFTIPGPHHPSAAESFPHLPLTSSTIPGPHHPSAAESFPHLPLTSSTIPGPHHPSAAESFPHLPLTLSTIPGPHHLHAAESFPHLPPRSSATPHTRSHA